MVGNAASSDGKMKSDRNEISPSAHDFCKDYIRGYCDRESCRYIHKIPHKEFLMVLFRFCHDFQNKGCFRPNCKFIHSTVEDEQNFYKTGVFPRDPQDSICPAYIRAACKIQNCQSIHLPDTHGESPRVYHVPLPNHPPPQFNDYDNPPEAKIRRYTHEDNGLDSDMFPTNSCTNCVTLEHKVKILHDNIGVLLKKFQDLTEKNIRLTSMNEFLLEQNTSRNDHPCIITSRHASSAPVSMATVSMTPIVSLAGALPTLVPGATPTSITLAPAVSQAQLLTPAPQILTVSTTQQLVGNSGALIVTSAGAQQLMQVSDSGTLMGSGQTMVAVPAQLTLGPSAQQLLSNASQTTVQQLTIPQLTQHQASQYAQQSAQHLAQQSAQHLAQQSAQHLAQQSAQHLAQQSAQHLAQQSAQHLAQRSAQHLAQQSAQHLAQQSAQHLAQQSAQHLAQQSAQHLVQQSAQHLAQQSAQHLAQQSAQHLAQQSQSQLVPTAQQLVHQTSTQQITISSTSQPMALPNSQAQQITFPIISQSILPH